MTRSHQDVVRVRLEKNGVVGWGETPAIPYYGLTAEQMLADLTLQKARLESSVWTDPRSFYAELQSLFPAQSFLRSALDTAAWDWFAQSKQQATWTLIDFPNPASAAATNYTIGLSSATEMLEEMQSFPWGSYKLKLGSDQDLEIIQHLIDNSTVPFRIDANGAWDARATENFIATCEKLSAGRVELIEEPFKDIRENGLADLAKDSPMPFFADESFQHAGDLEKLRPIFKGVNIKLDKCGGLTPAMELIRQSKAAGYLVQLGCMSSSGIGLAPAVQLSGAVDVVDLDSVLMIKGDKHKVYYENEVALVKF